MEAPRQSRFVVMLTDDEEQAIQNYRFENRIGTKAEAARRLISIGLRKEEGPVEAATSPSHDHEIQPVQGNEVHE